MCDGKRTLSYDEWRALPQPERRLLMRAAFGAPEVPPVVFAEFDLEQVRAMLEAHEAETAEIPVKWTDVVEDDLCE